MVDRRMILIATPEPLTGEELRGRFSGQGYKTIAVERGGDALLSVAEGNFSLVILDISIQDPSCPKTVEILRKMRPRLPVIVLSGDPSVETGREILQHGVFYYFLKPLDFEELDQIVHVALAPNKRLAAGTDQGGQRAKLGGEKGAAA